MNDLEKVLEQLQAGKISLEQAKFQLKPTEEMGFASLDLLREKRLGFPEVIYGEGKTAEQIADIMEKLMGRHHAILATRVSKEKAEEIIKRLPTLTYYPNSRCLIWQRRQPDPPFANCLAGICTAGTSDLAVAEEAGIVLGAMGIPVKYFADIGLAGLHRLLRRLDELRQCTLLIVVAGMEGALPSVVGGLVDKPIIAVPTNVGYGANFQGLSALLGMLNSCSPGLTVVNIDNGFGAGFAAARIIRLLANAR
jgi:hypothetical protein